MELRDIYAPISNELALVEAELARQVTRFRSSAGVRGAFARFIDTGLTHLFQTKGKQLRSALVTLSAKSAGEGRFENERTLIQLAASVELIHSASLIHDDVIDVSDTRRGRPAVHKVFGNKAAILIGDVLFSKAFTLLAELPIDDHGLHARLMVLFGEIAQKMCLGEISEARWRRSRGQPGKDEYLAIIGNKTGDLMAASCYAGALLAGAEQKNCDAVREYGGYFGLAYQLADDLADGDSLYDTGNTVRDDLKEYIAKSHRSLEPLRDSPEKNSLINLSESLLNGL